MKIKKLQVVVSMVLALCSLTSFSACKTDELTKLEWHNGTHDFTAPVTDYDLVKNGSTEYSLVYPVDGLNDQIRAARDEFIYFFEEATGITIKAIPDNDLQHSSTNKYISLGNTSLLESSGIEIDTDALTLEGTRIITKDQTVYLSGGSDYGTIYAVYDFMDVTFDYHYYGNDFYDINTDVKNVKLRKYDVTNVPDFEYRCYNIGYELSTYRNRMPYSYGGVRVKIHQEWLDEEEFIIDTSSAGKGTHNSLYYVPKEKFVAEHPGWYSDNGEQLCYTAHGDDEELELLAQKCADKMKGSFKAYQPDEHPFANSACVTMEDNHQICTCEACGDSKARYGTDSAAVIRFMNIVNEKIQAWMKEQKGQPWYREKIYTQFFAYHGFATPPAHYDEKSGKYVANDPSLYCSDGLSPWLAPISTDYTVDFYSDTNAAFRETALGWGALSDAVFYWTYETNFDGYLYMHDTFGFYTPECYQFLRACNGTQWFSQMQSKQKGSTTAFHNLKAYLTSQLSWNCNLNYEELIDDYFNFVYKDGASIMKNLWLQERLYVQYIRQDKTVSQGQYNILNNKKFWKYQTITSWMDMCDEARAAIAKYEKSNPEAYDRMTFLIDSEWVFPAYTALEYHSSEISPTELRNLQIRFKEVILRSNIVVVNEQGTLLTDYVANF